MHNVADVKAAEEKGQLVHRLHFNVFEVFGCNMLGFKEEGCVGIMWSTLLALLA